MNEQTGAGMGAGAIAVTAGGGASIVAEDRPGAVPGPPPRPAAHDRGVPARPGRRGIDRRDRRPCPRVPGAEGRDLPRPCLPSRPDPRTRATREPGSPTPARSGATSSGPSARPPGSRSSTAGPPRSRSSGRSSSTTPTTRLRSTRRTCRTSCTRSSSAPEGRACPRPRTRSARTTTPRSGSPSGSSRSTGSRSSTAPGCGRGSSGTVASGPGTRPASSGPRPGRRPAGSTRRSPGSRTTRHGGRCSASRTRPRAPGRSGPCWSWRSRRCRSRSPTWTRTPPSSTSGTAPSTSRPGGSASTGPRTT